MPDADGGASARLGHELRTFRSSPLDWLLLVGDRIAVASLLTLLFGVAVALVVATEPVTVDTDTLLLYLFQALVTGNLTLVTIVLSVNQLVLSREFNAPGELETRIGRAIDYRDSVRAVTGDDTVPIAPSDFLEVLLLGIRESALELRDVSQADDRGRLADEVEAVAGDVLTRADEASSALSEGDTDVFGALAVTLEINFSRELRDARAIRSSLDEDASLDADDAASAMDEQLASVVEGLKQVDVARQYFKSLYMQTELARFSRLLLYVGVPAIASGVLLLTVYAGAPGPSLGDLLSVVVPVVVAVSFAPLALVFAFVLRVSVVAQRTVAVTPFTMAPKEKDLVDGVE